MNFLRFVMTKLQIAMKKSRIGHIYTIKSTDFSYWEVGEVRDSLIKMDIESLLLIGTRMY